MFHQYRPRIIREPSSGLVHLLTCKKELAQSLVELLTENRIPAELSGTEADETMTSPEGRDTYVVSQISINPPADYEKVRAIVATFPEGKE